MFRIFCLICNFVLLKGWNRITLSFLSGQIFNVKSRVSSIWKATLIIQNNSFVFTFWSQFLSFYFKNVQNKWPLFCMVLVPKAAFLLFRNIESKLEKAGYVKLLWNQSGTNSAVYAVASYGSKRTFRSVVQMKFFQKSFKRSFVDHLVKWSPLCKKQMVSMICSQKAIHLTRIGCEIEVKNLWQRPDLLSQGFHQVLTSLYQIISFEKSGTYRLANKKPWRVVTMFRCLAEFHPILSSLSLISSRKKFHPTSAH